MPIVIIIYPCLTDTHTHTHTHTYIYVYIYIYIGPIQCLIFHCRPLSRRSPARPASLSWFLRVTVPGAFLRPAGGSCRVENLNSSGYVHHANLQLQQSHLYSQYHVVAVPELRLSYMVLISKV